MNTEVYFAEVIKPGGHQNVLTVPTAVGGPVPGLPVACTDRAQADAMWTSLIARIKDAPIKEGTMFRLVKFERTAELYEFIAPGSQIGFSS